MKQVKVSNNVIRRLPRYLRKLDELSENGVDKISSRQLGDLLGLTSSQVRQDFNCFGEFGQQGYGYNVSALRTQIAGILGMERGFSDRLQALRAAKGLSQRAVAADLHISQALLSHYENGAREPGLQFVCRACDYYGVSADYLLGRTDQPTLPAEQIERLRLAVRAMQSTAEQAAHALSSLTGDSEP